METIGADGAVTLKDGWVMITKGTAAALTLALPTAGADDGKELTFVDTTGAAHTITTPANGLNSALHIATCGGTKGQGGTLKAYNGGWWVTPSVTGFAIS